MKEFIVIIFCMIPFYVSSQTLPYDSTTSKITYSEVVDVNEATEKKLYELAQQWVAANSQGQYPLTITFDNNTNTVQLNGGLTYPSKEKKIDCLFTIKIQTKDGRYKFEFTNFQLSHTTEAGSSGGGFGYYSKSTYQEAQTFQYPLEQFYPDRLTKKNEVDGVKNFELVNAASFEKFNTQMNAYIGSLKQAMQINSDW